jgi:rsbT co-antagonist protein RsbR
MASSTQSRLADIVSRHQPAILDQWMRLQLSAATRRSDLIKEDELRDQSRQFLSGFVAALQKGRIDNVDGPEWAEVREALAALSSSRVRQGFTSSETATFVFSLKEPLFGRLREENAKDPAAWAEDTWAVSSLVDRLGLQTVEAFQKTREDVIRRQQEELIELSTPVVKVWDGILAVPLIGTLDSARTQVVMESLLQQIVDTGSAIAIIDITGVPTVDTLVAQHLLKTVAAARLMGADCIISGVRPQIAQTIVHLGVDLGDVITKPTLAHALSLAFRRAGLTVTRGAATA